MGYRKVFLFIFILVYMAYGCCVDVFGGIGDSVMDPKTYHYTVNMPLQEIKLRTEAFLKYYSKIAKVEEDSNNTVEHWSGLNLIKYIRIESYIDREYYATIYLEDKRSLWDIITNKKNPITIDISFSCFFKETTSYNHDLNFAKFIRNFEEYAGKNNWGLKKLMFK